MALPKKEFVIRHVMENVSEMEEGKKVIINEEHFGIPWRLRVRRLYGQLNIFLSCEKCNNSPWSIDTRFEFKLISPSGESTNAIKLRTFSSSGSAVWGWDKFISWERLMKYFAVDDKTIIEVRVVIEKMEGCGKTENLRDFDENANEFSDVVLVFLALQSSYFKGLLFGNFEESKKEEVTLNDIDPDDFQNFLEALHGELSIDDSTVDGILFLADMYDAPTVLRRCEEFLWKDSKRSLKGKFELSLRYKLEKLKAKCISGIKTNNEMKEVLPKDIKDLDHSILVELFKKSLDLR